MELLRRIPILGVSSASKKKSRLSYSVTFKLAAVEHAETHGNRATARYLGINEKQIRDWRSKKSFLLNTKSDAKRLKGAGRQVSDARREQELKAWIEEEQKNGNMISRSDVQKKAKTFSNDGHFKASSGWLRRWKIRNNYTLNKPIVGLDINDIMISKMSSVSLNDNHHQRYHVMSPVKRTTDIEKEFKDRIQCALALLELNSDRKVHCCEQRAY